VAVQLFATLFDWTDNDSNNNIKTRAAEIND